MTWIKICGITNLEDAQTAVAAGADALGFVFYDKSPRKIDPEMARQIVTKIPESIEKVGVFVAESLSKVSEIADQANLTAVQLHGNVEPLPASAINNRKIFLSVPAESLKGEAWGKFCRFPESLAAIFIDSQEVGGTGHAFNWERTTAFVSVISKQYPIVIAGGLTPNKVKDAISILHPWGVDVSSGVEARPGKKDPEKIRAFVDAVRNTEKIS